MPTIKIDLEPPHPGGDFFKPDSDHWNNAYVGHNPASWYVYAEAYWRAADSLARNSRHDIDFVVYPIVFLYRQYLELSLKSLIVDAEEWLGVEPSPWGTHNLNAVWAHCRTRLGAAWTEPISDWLGIIDKCVTQFSNIDPTSQAFRYPVYSDGSPVEHALRYVNLRNLAEEMTNVAKVIEVLSGGLSAMVDQKREFASEW